MLNDINTSSYHTPIMLPQVLSLLRPERGGTYVDGTLGGGGHSLGILRSLPAGGRLFGIDRDGEAIAEASESLAEASAIASPKPPQGFRFFRISRLFAAIFFNLPNCSMPAESTVRTESCLISASARISSTMRSADFHTEARRGSICEWINPLRSAHMML